MSSNTASGQSSLSMALSPSTGPSSHDAPAMPPPTRLSSAAPSVAHSVATSVKDGNESVGKASSSSISSRSRGNFADAFSAYLKKTGTTAVSSESGAVPQQKPEPPKTDPGPSALGPPVLPTISPVAPIFIGDSDDDVEAAEEAEERYSISSHPPSSVATVAVDDQFEADSKLVGVSNSVYQSQ